MRQVKQSDVWYNTDENCCSVFVGVCSSPELFEQYWEQDYDLLSDDCIDFEMGIDFGINFYDEDFCIMKLQNNVTDNIDELFKDAEDFDIDALKSMYPHNLDRPYNAVMIFHQMMYDGEVKESENETFGYFKFLGVFNSR